MTLFNSSPVVVAVKRKNLKINISSVLKCATSTLDVEEDKRLSPPAIEKRRNKLGYRPACRRRKIRCVFSGGNGSKSCSNCTRLKKECIFNPVDFKGGPESLARPESGMGSKSLPVISNLRSGMQPPASNSNYDLETGRLTQQTSIAPSEYGSNHHISRPGIETSGTPIVSEDASDTRYGPHPGLESASYPGDNLGTELPMPAQWVSSQMGDLATSTTPTSTTNTAEHASSLNLSYSFAYQDREYDGPQSLRSMPFVQAEPSFGSFALDAPAPIDLARFGPDTHYNSLPLNTVPLVMNPLTEPSMRTVASEMSLTSVGMYPSRYAGHCFRQQQQSRPSMHLDFNNPQHDLSSTHWYHHLQLGSGLITVHDQRHQQTPIF
ncbi:hypothetical protein E4T44_01441 [Aureobasidium sp. EXF-8845]|nr:hypothetical protein E4T44_01441 [Aureobasidium sp. EXF-8845]KAI4857173.1 hypothetical protein E4T45_01342 [Aureobasidium sp. EXF-8846]